MRADSGTDAAAGQGSVLSRTPWWGLAIVASLVIVVLAVPQHLRIGSVGFEHSPWYRAPDGAVSRLNIDQAQYQRLTDAFAGDSPTEVVVAPFSSRALAPLVASRLPVDAALALTLVNIGSLVAGTFALAALMHRLARRRAATVAALAAWALSFAVFWYTGKRLVDPAAAGLVAVVLWAACSRRRILGAAVLVAAVWTKEVAAFAALPLVALEVADPDSDAATTTRRSALWLVAAGGAFLTTGILATGADVVFAPWLPPALVSARQFLVTNLTTSGLLQYLLTALPAVFALVWWLPSRRRRDFPATAPLVIPMLVGIVVMLVLGVWSLWSALFDGRTVWLAAPFAAVLVGLWADVTAPQRLWRELAGTSVRVGVALVALVVVGAGVGSVATSQWGEATDDAEAEDAEPLRFAEPPEGGVAPVWEQAEGTGPSELPTLDDGPYLVRFTSDEPATIDGPNGPQPHTPVRSGTVMVDGTGTARIETDGAWSVDVVPVDATLHWEAYSPLTGHGPAVVLFPGGLFRERWVHPDFEDEADRIELVADCRLGTCPEPEDDLVPAGTEALVVDAAGEWELIPEWRREGTSEPDGG